MTSIRALKAWGPFEETWFTSLPETVKHEPHPQVFDGRRLVIGMGVVGQFGLHARIVTGPLAFPHSMLGFPLAHRPAWQADVALGVLLSSIGRYWLSMVSGGWGAWRDQVRKEQLMKLPLRLTRASDPTVRRITAAVKNLPRATPAAVGATTLWEETPGPGFLSLDSLLMTLDDAVADLFEMTSAERDLVADYWAAQRPASVDPIVMSGDIREGRARDLAHVESSGLRGYVKTFLDVWNPQLNESGEFSWEIHSDTESRTVAVVFETRGRDDVVLPRTEWNDDGSWSNALKRIADGLTNQRAASLRSHGMLRVVTDTAIVIVKRDEQRLWTKTAARDDAEATTVQAMTLEST
jgi:hypothetical protein